MKFPLLWKKHSFDKKTSGKLENSPTFTVFYLLKPSLCKINFCENFEIYSAKTKMYFDQNTLLGLTRSKANPAGSYSQYFRHFVFWFFGYFKSQREYWGRHQLKKKVKEFSIEISPSMKKTDFDKKRVHGQTLEGQRVERTNPRRTNPRDGKP